MKKIKFANRIFIEIAAIRVLVIVIQLVFLKLYTHYTSVKELGVYIFLITVSYSLNAFLLVPFDFFQQSQLYKLKNEHYSLRSFFPINSWVIKFGGSVLIVSLVICFFINRSYCKVVPFVVLYSLSLYFVTLIRGFINNLERRRVAIYCIFLEIAFKILFYLLFNKLFGSSALVILASVLLASACILIVLFFILRKMPEYKEVSIFKYYQKDIFNFSYPISIGAVINWIQVQGYSMILVPLGLTDIVGIYGTVAQVGTGGMGAYSTVFGQVFVPNLYKTNGAYVKKYMRNGFLSICFVLVCGYAISGFLVELLTKRELVKYSSVIVFGILTEGGSLLIGALSIYLTIHNLTKVSIKVSLVGLVCFFLSFFLLYFFKIISVYTIGIPIVLTQFVITIYLMVIVYKLMSKKTTG